MADLDPYREWSHANGRYKTGFLHEYQEPIRSELRQGYWISEAYVARQRRIKDAVGIALRAQCYQKPEHERPQRIQEKRKEAWFLLHHTLGLKWTWFEATTFFQEMFGRESTVIATRMQHMYWKNRFLGEVPWEIKNLRALYAAVSAYEAVIGLPMAQIVRARQYRGWPHVVGNYMVTFGSTERIPDRSIRVKYHQAFPRRPLVQQQQSAPQLLIE